MNSPLQILLPEPIFDQLKPDAKANLLSTTFFTSAISPSFIEALRSVFLFSSLLTLFAALSSALRGQPIINEENFDPSKLDVSAAVSAH